MLARHAEHKDNRVQDEMSKPSPFCMLSEAFMAISMVVLTRVDLCFADVLEHGHK